MAKAAETRLSPHPVLLTSGRNNLELLFSNRKKKRDELADGTLSGGAAVTILADDSGDEEWKNDCPSGINRCLSFSALRPSSSDFYSSSDEAGNKSSKQNIKKRNGRSEETVETPSPCADDENEDVERDFDGRDSGANDEEIDEEEINDLVEFNQRFLGTVKRNSRRRRRIRILSDSSSSNDDNDEAVDTHWSDNESCPVAEDDDANDTYDYSDSFIDDEHGEQSEKASSSSSDADSAQNVTEGSDVNESEDSSESEAETPKSRGTASSSSTRLTFLASLSSADVTSNKRCQPDALKYLKQFSRHKVELGKRLYEMFNEDIFDGVLPPDMELVWSSRLTKTAGTCRLKSKKDGKTGSVSRFCEIRLSAKVVDSPARLRDTLVHEMCHAAAWSISGCKGGHGPVWKSWAKKATTRYGELPAIRRCHNYEIRTRYAYRCRECGQTYGRHSKSIDTEHQRCGKCGGSLELLLSAPESARAPNRFALFVKDNYKACRTPGASHAEAMKQISELFAKTKIENLQKN